MAELEKIKQGAIPRSQSFYDFMKHLTTLSTGSIVLLATFAEKFSKDAAWRMLLPIAMSSFLLSVFSSLICMFFAISYQRYESRPPKWEVNILTFSLLLSFVALFLGLLAIGGFAIKNF